MRVRRFAAETTVNRRFLVEEPDALRLVVDNLTERLGDEGRGSRGGRYLLFGDAEVTQGESTEDFLRNTFTVRMTRMGRYVRPKRRS